MGRIGAITKSSELTIDSGFDLSGGDYDILMKAGRTVDGKDVSALAAALSELSIDADLPMGAHDITLDAAQTVDGVDVSDHDARHSIGGSDEILDFLIWGFL